MRLLVANDGSNNARAAIERVGARLWPEGTSIHVIAVADLNRSPSGKLTRDQAVAANEKAVSALKMQLPAANVIAEVMEGNAAQLLVDYAGKHKPDLLVSGFYSRKGVDKALKGSVLDPLWHETHCSMLIVKESPQQRTVVERRFLLCLDDSPYGERVAEEVKKRVWPKEAEFLALRVISPEYKTFSENPRIDAEQSIKFEQHRADGAALEFASELADLRLALSGRKLDVTVRQDVDPAEGILLTADNWKADTIFTGSHDRVGLNRFLLGSVSEEVAKHCACAVEIVKMH